MLAAQIVESANEAAPTLAVIIAAAGPVRAILTEKLQQQVEHLHRFAGVCLAHCLLLTQG